MPADALVLDFERSYFGDVYERLGLVTKWLPLRADLYERAADEGSVDALTLTFTDYAEGSSNLIRISEPVLTLEYRAFSLSTPVEIDGWRGLADHHACVFIGDKLAELRTWQYPRRLVPTLKDAVRAIRGGDCDVLVASHLIWINIDAQGLGPLCESASVFETFPAFHYVNRSHRNLVRPLQNAIREANRDGTRDKYFAPVQDRLSQARARAVCRDQAG